MTPGGADDAAVSQHKALIGLAAKAHALLSKALWKAADYAEAERELACAIDLCGDDGWRIRQAIFLPMVTESRPDIERRRADLQSRLSALLGQDLHVDDPVGGIDWTCFLLAYHGEHNNAGLHTLFHQVCARASPSLRWVAPHVADPGDVARGEAARGEGRRPRIGFVSWYLNEHTISRLFVGLIARLDVERFDISLFSIAGNDAAVHRPDLAGAAIVRLPADLSQARDRIAAARLDVLVYLDLGMDPFTLFLAHARLARLQAVLWGHPDTTGLPSIDVFLSSDAMEPADGDEHYTERLVRLPGIGTWMDKPLYAEDLPLSSLPRTRESRAAPSAPVPLVPRLRAEQGETARRDESGDVPQALLDGLPAGAPLLVCPQTPQKFHPDFDPVLRRILNAEPTAHLVLTAGWDGAAMEVVRLRLVAPDPVLAARIHVLGPLPRDRFIGLLRRADVLLDPPHYSGGHTTLEAFACGGAPVVTWPGRHMRSRHTYGFYRLMGILDAVAADLDAYADITLGLLRDAARRDALRHRIAAASHRLFEDQSVVDAFEAFLWVAAHAPEQWAAHPAGEQSFGNDGQRHDDG